MLREQWTGDEWETWCLDLLSIRYGENVQQVPDRVKGDHGLEAFRLDCGTVYQCYAPEAAMTINQITEAVKSKIRRDIRTLTDKQQEVCAMLGAGYRISRWVLLTPELDDKELLKYAAYKSERVCGADPRPTWCDEADFRIVVATDRTLFPTELRVLAQAGTSIQLRLPVPDISEATAELDEGMSQTITDKFLVNAVLAADGGLLARYRDQTVLDYVYGTRQLDVLENKYTAVFEQVKRRSDLVLRSVTRQLASSSASQQVNTEELVRQFREGLESDAPALAAAAREELGHHYVASWWIACPLRYVSP